MIERGIVIDLLRDESKNKREHSRDPKIAEFRRALDIAY